MGCTDSLQVKQHHSISTSTLKVKFILDKMKQHLKAQGLQHQKQLIKQINQSKKFRNKKLQQTIMSQIVYCLNKITIAFIIHSDCQKILQYKHIIDDQEKFSILQQSIKRILYASSILTDEAFNNFQKIVLWHYPYLRQIQDSQIEEQQLRHHKRTVQPTRKMINQYAFKLVLQKSVTLQKLNEIGHNFRY